MQHLRCTFSISPKEVIHIVPGRSFGQKHSQSKSTSALYRALHTQQPKMAKNFGDEEQRTQDQAAHEMRADSEKEIKRNPHPDFGKVEASRPNWRNKDWDWTKTKAPNWKFGQGANDGGECLKKKHIEIDPYEKGRPAAFNYKLMISAIVPRPIGFLSTRSKDGKATITVNKLAMQGRVDTIFKAYQRILQPSATPKWSTMYVHPFTKRKAGWEY